MKEILRTWSKTNQRLLLIFVILLVITVPLSIYTVLTNLPTFSSYTSILHSQSSRVAGLLQMVSTPLKTAEYESFSRNVQLEAKTSEYIEVAGCNLSPVITRVRIKNSITFRNSDAKVHFITLPGKKAIRVDPLGSATVPLTFVKQTPSIFGIGCDSRKEAAGILYITE